MEKVAKAVIFLGIQLCSLERKYAKTLLKAFCEIRRTIKSYFHCDLSNIAIFVPDKS